MMLGMHTSMSTKTAITNFGWTVLPHPLCRQAFTPSDFHLLGLFFWGWGGGGKEKEVGETCEDTITPMKRHC